MEDFWIDGFGISNYRSFGPEPQLIGPCGKINLIVGQNNCGKSNVLRFLSEHYVGLLKTVTGNSGYTRFSDLDNPVGIQVEERKFWVALRLDTKAIEQHSTISLDNNRLRHINQDLVRQVLGLKPFTNETEVAWFRYVIKEGQATILDKHFLSELQRCKEFPEGLWGRLHQDIFKSSGSGNLHDTQARVLSAIGPIRRPFAEVTSIPAIREVTQGEAGKRHPSGKGLIEELAELQHPSGWQDNHLKDTFRKIERFLQTVTGHKDAGIEIPNDRKSILVNIDGKRLPLTELGTGIHEVIIIAAHATVSSKEVICVEEPEIHLHPTLQKKLIQYLQANTDNQYFIATHSAHLLDSPDATVFHARMEDGHSVVQKALSPRQRSSICFDLGYRPSDLMQANCVVWVEGPSDRIYLNHWIKTVDSELVEGTHYSIMFYGGRLLSHLSGNDPEVEEFISLRRLNRRMIILMDSDRDGAEGGINDTKQRICNELSGSDGLAWVTQGREIENYLPVKMTTAAIKSIHQDATVTVDAPGFGKRLQFTNIHGESKTADKIKVARCVVKQEADLSVLDLQEMVGRTVEFIRKSNEMCSTP